MTLNKVRFSAHEEEFVEAAKLSLSTVAQVYHVNPTMIGLLDNANFSNVREFRRMLYGDTLGPTIAMIESRLNGFLLPMLGEDADRYLEFNIREKLQGSFEEQTQALQSAVGRPWMLADEARALLNMPALGGDATELVTPLNVIVGGQASPRDSAPKSLPHWNEDSLRLKERAPETRQQQVERVISAFFKRQESAVMPLLTSKADPDWWDAERWDRELSDDLFRLASATTSSIGKSTATRLGFGEDDYNVDQTLKFLRTVADSRAGMVNSTTRDRIAKALDIGDSPSAVFEQGKTTRSAEIAATLVTTFSAFATAEAAKQVAGDKATKTWIVTSTNPRASHAAMSGETVLVSEDFSNGMAWPGDANGGADEVAGCTCDLQIDIP